MTLAFEGRLDSEGCAHVHAPVVEQLDRVQSTQTLCFDLAGADFVASAFLRLCILAVKKFDADRFELAHLAPPVREVFVMAGLDNHLRIVD